MENYIRPEDKIYEIATAKDAINWKSLLIKIIEEEGIDPFDIDLSKLTKKYIETIKRLKKVDFEISGKILIVAVYLLKIKVECLLDKEIRKIEKKLKEINEEEVYEDIISPESIEQLEEIDNNIDIKQKSYHIKLRNPIARKRRVNLNDLIKILEKTLESSRRRRENILMRKRLTEYDGPNYHKNKKDLKKLIEEIYEIILNELKEKKSHIRFSSLTKDKTKDEIIEIFFPILHLHNREKIKVSQDEPFGEIYISKK